MQAIDTVDLIVSPGAAIELNPIGEARRQFEICNACRYCEGYCSVFPAVHRERTFSDAEIEQIANLCHNCRSCHYACQYTAPHEFAINLPSVLAEVRQQSWQDNAVPGFLARAFHRSGVAIALVTMIAFVLLFWTIQSLDPGDGEGFYALLSHNAMVALFAPAFLLPLIAVTISVRRYWRRIGGEPIRLAHLQRALGSVAKMKNLAGGHGEGCNFEDEDRFSHARRGFHQATMYGFLLCFAATSVGTLMHYVLALPAPYDLISLPKLLGISGGVLLSAGTLGLAVLKYRADPDLADASVWSGEMAFIALLFLVSTSGLALAAVSQTSWLPAMLAIHLGAVLTFFLLTPFSKMVHGFYRLAALIRDQQRK